MRLIHVKLVNVKNKSVIELGRKIDCLDLSFENIVRRSLGIPCVVRVLRNSANRPIGKSEH